MNATTNAVIDLATQATSKGLTTADWVFLGFSILLAVTVATLFILGRKDDKGNYCDDEFFWDE